MNGYLVLENGPLYEGEWLGGAPRAGEVVFNTSHNGYQEVATDPSYFGQIIVMCAPEQGNYGIDEDESESSKAWIQGFVSLQMDISSYRQGSWQNYLDSQSIPILKGIDTRRLVLYLRDHGTQKGAIVQAATPEEARIEAKRYISEFEKLDSNWVSKVSRSQKTVIAGDNPSGPKVAVIDYGCKTNILRELQTRCSQLTVFPWDSHADDILKEDVDGILLSNGPGNPEDVPGAVGVIQQLLGRKIIFGICMGHQLLSLALGGTTFRLKFGHRGANHPVKNLLTGEIFVTSQNHGYAVEQISNEGGVQITHMNLNDNTVSGIENKNKKCFSVQFHPESHPGPRDGDVLFDQFIDWIDHDLR